MNEMNRDEANLGIVNISDEVIGVVAGDRKNTRLNSSHKQ